MTSAKELENWRIVFEMIGPTQLRRGLEHRRSKFSPAYTREVEIWLLEKDAENAAIELQRFLIILRWAILVGVAGIVAAITGSIAASPIIRGWIADAYYVSSELVVLIAAAARFP